MKHLHLILALFLAVGLTASSAWPKNEGVQEGIMDLKSREFGQQRMPAVSFDHFSHENIVRCRVCHHDFYIFSDRSNGKGSKCSGCHKQELNKDIPVPLLMAFHKKCIGCHENYLKWGRRSGPVMCGVCHMTNLSESDR